MLIYQSKNIDGHYYYNGEPVFLKRGQCFCNRFELAENFDLKRNQANKVWRVLDFLQKTVKLISKQKTRNGSIITILNFDKLTQFEQSNELSMSNQRVINEQSMSKPIIDKSVKSVKSDKSDKRKNVEIENKNYKNQAIEILDFLNSKKKTTRPFLPSKVNLDFIIGRLKEIGVTPDMCRQIIALKCRQWIGTESEKFLRPATLFNTTKFNQYVGELKVIPQEAGK